MVFPRDRAQLPHLSPRECRLMLTSTYNSQKSQRKPLLYRYRTCLFPPHLERLQRVSFPPTNLKRPPAWLSSLVPSLFILLLERNKSDIPCQCLLAVFRQKVVWNVLKVRLLSRRPSEFSIMSEMGQLGGVLFKIPGPVSLAHGRADQLTA